MVPVLAGAKRTLLYFCIYIFKTIYLIFMKYENCYIKKNVLFSTLTGKEWMLTGFIIEQEQLSIYWNKQINPFDNVVALLSFKLHGIYCAYPEAHSSVSWNLGWSVTVVLE